MTPLDITCRTCRRAPGQPCVDYHGTRIETHHTRYQDSSDAWLESLGYEPLHGGKP